MREVTINSVLNGWIVKVGCKQLVFTKKDKLLKELGKYMDDPAGVQKQYEEKYNLPTEILGVWGPNHHGVVVDQGERE